MRTSEVEARLLHTRGPRCGARGVPAPVPSLGRFGRERAAGAERGLGGGWRGKGGGRREGGGREEGGRWRGGAAGDVAVASSSPYGPLVPTLTLTQPNTNTNPNSNLT